MYSTECTVDLVARPSSAEAGRQAGWVELRGTPTVTTVHVGGAAFGQETRAGPGSAMEAFWKHFLHYTTLAREIRARTYSRQYAHHAAAVLLAAP